MAAAGACRRVLIVDDDQAFTHLVQTCLEEAHFTTTITTTGARAIEHIVTQGTDLMLLDFRLSDMDANQVLDALDRRGCRVPFLVVTGRSDCALAAQLIKRGACDYLLKEPCLTELLPSVVEQAFAQVDRDRRLADAERRIHEQHRLLQAVLEALPHPLCVIDAVNHDVKLMNRSARMSARHPLSLNSSSRGSEDPNWLAGDSPIAEVLRTRSSLAFEHVEYDGHEQASVHEIYLYPVLRASGEVHEVVEYSLDVTSRKRAEQALRQSEACLRQAVESLPFILVSREVPSRRLTLMMGAVREIIGYEPHQFQEDVDLLMKMIDPQDVESVIAAAKHSIANRETFDLEFRVRHGITGRTVWLRAQGAPIYDEEGSLLRVDSILVDITREKELAREREELDNRLQQAHRLESLGVLAGGIAHDFSNLLTIINGNVQFLRESMTADPVQAKALADIEAAARSAGDMTRSLQAFSRPSKPHIVHLDANTMIHEVYRFLRRLMPVRVDFQFFPAPKACLVAADPAQMQQVLINLCINARDAIKGTGRVILRTRQITSSELPTRLRFEADNREYVEISVRDSGCGMDEQTLRHVFDPFFTTKAKDQGTGLGLAITYKIIRAHGGMVDVVSEPGQGTEFRVYLPAAAPAPESAAPATRPPRGTERVLVVDDEPMIASLVKTLLEGNGYRVAVAHRPEQAIALARDSTELIELAVFDYELPGMSGDKCLLELRNRWPDLKAILITGYEIDPAELNLFDVRILQKPFSSQSITQAVRTALDGTA